VQRFGVGVQPGRQNHPRRKPAPPAQPAG
jgi:hypothetical protein